MTRIVFIALDGTRTLMPPPDKLRREFTLLNRDSGLERRFVRAGTSPTGLPEYRETAPS